MNDRRFCLVIALAVSACGSQPAQRSQLPQGLIMRYVVTGALTSPEITYEVDRTGRVTFNRRERGNDQSDSGQLTPQELRSLRSRLERASVCSVRSRREVLADARTKNLDVRMGAMDCHLVGHLGDDWPSGLQETIRWLYRITQR